MDYLENFWAEGTKRVGCVEDTDPSTFLEQGGILQVPCVVQEFPRFWISYASRMSMVLEELTELTTFYLLKLRL